VELTRQTHVRELANICVILAAAQKLDLTAEYDVVFSNSTLHWAPDHPAVLRGLFQASAGSERRTLTQNRDGWTLDEATYSSTTR
jgi:trans-aconitate methyltransferase